MSALRYIYVTDQGGVFSSEDEPTTDDFAFTNVGMLVIIRLADAHYYGREGRWLPVPAGKLVTPEMPGEESTPFHSVAQLFHEPILPNPQATAPRGQNSNGWIRRSSPADARRRRFTAP